MSDLNRAIEVLAEKAQKQQKDERVDIHFFEGTFTKAFMGIEE